LKTKIRNDELLLFCFFTGLRAELRHSVECQIMKKLVRKTVLATCLMAPLVALAACSQPQVPTAESDNSSAEAAAESPDATVAQTPDGDGMTSEAGQSFTPLFSHIWRVDDATNESAPGSIFIFVANGTLLQTSCVETYGIYGWSVDKDAPNRLNVEENGQLAYTADIRELTNETLELELNLVLSNEIKEMTLSAVEEEFVCPDLPR
jgi:hypothetical protein